jgi:hypothetical protein
MEGLKVREVLVDDVKILEIESVLDKCVFRGCVVVLR